MQVAKADRECLLYRYFLACSFKKEKMEKQPREAVGV